VPPPEFKKRPTDDEALTQAYARTMAYAIGSKLDGPLADTSMKNIARVLGELRAIPAGWGEKEVAAQLATFIYIVRGFLAHEQRRVPIPMHVFQVAERNPNHKPQRPETLGWDGHAEELHHITVPGDHFSMMHEHNIPKLARLIDDRLQNARDQSDS